MKVIAIIPARSGSKGVAHKNIRTLAGHPLLAWSIAAAKLSRRIDRVLVSTDSEEYAQIARRYCAEVPFLRPAEFARDDSLDNEFIAHALTWLREHEGSVPEYLAHLRPTCPNRNPAIIDQAVEIMISDAQATSLISVHPGGYPPCKYYRLNEAGLLQGYMGDEYINLPRQSCPQAYQGNGHIDLYKTSSILENNTLLGAKALPFVCPDPGDIDAEEDFQLLEATLNASDNILKQNLSEITGKNAIIRKHGKAIAMEQLGRSIAWRKETASEMQKTAAACTIVGQRTQCPICASDDLEAYTTIHACTYSLCRDCGHLFQREVIKVEEIKSRYDKKSAYLTLYTAETFFQKHLDMVARPKVAYISEIVRPKAGDEWLDIGSGGCQILYAAREMGWQVRGIEAGVIGVAHGQKYGIPVAQCYITPENIHTFLTTAPRLLSLFNVFEHLPDPQSILTAIGQTLSSHTTVVIAVPRHPSLSSLASQLFPGLAVRHLIIPDHIHIFSEESLELLLKNCGLKMTHIWTYGQDFYEIMSMLTMAAGNEINCWPSQLMTAFNDIQKCIDDHGLSDSMLIISEKM